MGRYLPSVNQGWVSVLKPVERIGGVTRLIPVDSEMGSYSLNNDRISLPTPKEGVASKDLKGKSNKQQGNSSSGIQVKRYTPLSDDGLNPWLSQKIRQCGEVVGITVDNNKAGWESLLAFAH